MYPVGRWITSTFKNILCPETTDGSGGARKFCASIATLPLPVAPIKNHVFRPVYNPRLNTYPPRKGKAAGSGVVAAAYARDRRIEKFSGVPGILTGLNLRRHEGLIVPKFEIELLELGLCTEFIGKAGILGGGSASLQAEIAQKGYGRLLSVAITCKVASSNLARNGLPLHLSILAQMSWPSAGTSAGNWGHRETMGEK